LTKHVSVQDSSGSAAMQTFTGGKGDVLLSYESEALAAQKKGLAVDYVVPKQTILIETPIAVTAKSAHAAQAKAFVQWLWSPAAHVIPAPVPGPGPAISKPRPRARRAGAGRRADRLGLGVTMLYLSVVVLIPLAAVAVKAFSSGFDTFWSSITSDIAVKALVI